ncbi:MAG: cyclic 2,3-diphosphoglycerate synthase [Acidobacteriota bacterium]
MRKIAILGAAGRDFHNFNVVFREDSRYQVVAFTATQIPGIDGRRYPPELAGSRYPEGIPIVPEEALEQLIREEAVDVVVFSYSDVPYSHIMHLSARALAAGADFWLLSAERTQIKPSVPLLSVCAVRTGCGKSPTSRKVAAILRDHDLRLVVIRHPMPYGDLARQAVQRFSRLDDLDRHECTIEEREEYEAHLRMGTIVYAGIDYARIIREAEKEADVVLWDGGNNDTSFYRSDLEIVVTDPLRCGHELAYYPGEVNLRRADVVLINKVNTASPENVAALRQNIQRVNPDAIIVEGDSLVRVPHAETIRGKRVLVIEDGPTVTHGGMAYGAGVIAARQNEAAELVDPRPYSVGSIRATFERYPHLSELLPAMGYGEVQQRELEKTIDATPCDLVLVATPIDLAGLIEITKPSLRVTYDLAERTQPDFGEIVADFIARHVRLSVAAQSLKKGTGS